MLWYIGNGLLFLIVRLAGLDIYAGHLIVGNWQPIYMVSHLNLKYLEYYILKPRISQELKINNYR